MAVTGIALLLYVFAHLIGNLKLFLSKEELNLYGEALRDVPGHLLPRTVLLWAVRIGLVAQRHVAEMRGPARATFGTPCSQPSWHAPPITRRSP